MPDPESAQAEGAQFAAATNVVLAKVCACDGCTRMPSLDPPHSYCFTYRDPAGSDPRQRMFFLPHPLTPEGYTRDQFGEIERTLASYGIDLLPLDPALAN